MLFSPKPPANMLLYTRLAPAKIPKKRSRSGCVYCKDKKKKCDEVRPQCARCLEKGQDCVYEPIRPRQRRRRDEISNTTDPVCSSSPPDSAPAPAATSSKRRQSTSQAHHRRSSTAIERPVVCRPSALSQPPVSPKLARNPAPAADPTPIPTPNLNPPRSPSKWSPEITAVSRLSQRVEIAVDTELDDEDIEQLDPEQADMPLISPNIFNAAIMSFSPLDSLDFPGIESLGLDFDLPMIDSPDDATLDSRSTGSSSSTDDVLVGAGLTSGIEQDLALVPTDSHVHSHSHFSQSDEREQRGSVSSTTSLTPEISFSVPHYDSQLQQQYQQLQPQPQIHFDFNLPNFFEFSDLRNRRALIDHFCNVLSHLLVFKEDSGNPFQQLVLPLCHNSIVVTNAVYALASAHLEHRGVEFSETSDFFHRQVITGLAKLIAQSEKANRNELLASIMLLIYYEALVQKGRSSIVDDHLRGALTVMTTHHQSPVFPNATDQFLERAFKFYDVISALSLGRAPLSHSYVDTTPNFLNLTPTPSGNSIDSLLGMFTTLWPIIHRLSALQGLKRNLAAATNAGNTSSIPILKAEFETGSAAIETALEEWQPELPGGCSMADFSPEVSSLAPASAISATDSATALHPAQGRVRSILNNALAYRHGASVFLYRSIYGCARDHPLVQRHTHAALVHCMRTVQNAGPMSALLWPLFVAACEAANTADRDLARRAFLAVDRRQGMVNIQHAWTIVQEVWKRADALEESSTAVGRETKDELVLDVPKNKFEEDLWRTVSEDLGIKVVFG
ncbi:uncharacterized protein BROUX77_001157 [Berkeleyomyces rouxiae]|uniref:uncharacterized protein n=1 Tax=Berkeleyomyces rouxiae TaxID=2035830 RepID=UPI003B7D6672